MSRWEDFSSLLDEFYEERDRQDRMRVKAQDLLRLLANASERLSRKINLQRGELARSEDREHLRVCGDLINANPVSYTHLGLVLGWRQLIGEAGLHQPLR